MRFKPRMQGGSSDTGSCAGPMEAAGVTDARRWLQPSCPGAIRCVRQTPPPPPQPRSGRLAGASLSAACDCQAQGRRARCSCPLLSRTSSRSSQLARPVAFQRSPSAPGGGVRLFRQPESLHPRGSGRFPRRWYDGAAGDSRLDAATLAPLADASATRRRWASGTATPRTCPPRVYIPLGVPTGLRA
jgi:hypothetical protein